MCTVFACPISINVWLQEAHSISYVSTRLVPREDTDVSGGEQETPPRPRPSAAQPPDPNSCQRYPFPSTVECLLNILICETMSSHDVTSKNDVLCVLSVFEIMILILNVADA